MQFFIDWCLLRPLAVILDAWIYFPTIFKSDFLYPMLDLFLVLVAHAVLTNFEQIVTPFFILQMLND